MSCPCCILPFPLPFLSETSFHPIAPLHPLLSQDLSLRFQALLCSTSYPRAAPEAAGTEARPTWGKKLPSFTLLNTCSLDTLFH